MFIGDSSSLVTRGGVSVITFQHHHFLSLSSFPVYHPSSMSATILVKTLPQFQPQPFRDICNIFVSVHLITPIGKGCVYSFVKLVLVLSCLGISGFHTQCPHIWEFQIYIVLTTLSELSHFLGENQTFLFL